ncbi:MAG: PQQ-binding-like beta-propeller repeat protein [Pirellulales bacterium]
MYSIDTKGQRRSPYAGPSTPPGLKWKFDVGNYMYATPTIGPDGTIYAPSYNSTLYAINPDGTLKWDYDAGSLLSSSVAIDASGTLYQLTFATGNSHSIRSKTVRSTPVARAATSLQSILMVRRNGSTQTLVPTIPLPRWEKMARFTSLRKMAFSQLTTPEMNCGVMPKWPETTEVYSSTPTTTFLRLATIEC